MPAVTSRYRAVRSVLLVAAIALGGALLFAAGLLHVAGYSRTKSLVDGLAHDGLVDSFTTAAYTGIRGGLAIASLCLISSAAFAVFRRQVSDQTLSSTVEAMRRIWSTDMAVAREILERARSHIKLPLGIALCCWALYMATGFRLAMTDAFSKNELLFDADVHVVIQNVTSFYSDHTHGNAHPLVLVLFNPPGVLLASALRSPERAAVVITSFCGSIAVALAYLFLRSADVSKGPALLWTLAFALSASHLFFSSVPETYGLSTLGLAAIYLAAARSPGNVVTNLLPGAYMLGITATNIIYASVAFLCGAWQKTRDARAAFYRLAFFLVAVGLLVFPLNMVQVIAYRTWPYFLPWAYQSKLSWVVPVDGVSDILGRLSLLLRALFLDGMVAQQPFLRNVGQPFDESSRALLEVVMGRGASPAVVSPPAGLGYHYEVGLMAAVVWIAVMFTAAFRFLRSRARRTPLAVSLLIGIVLSGILHFRFGNDLFLYSAHWTFLVWGWTAVCLGNGRGLWALVPPGALVVLLAANDWAFFSDLCTIFSISSTPE